MKSTILLLVSLSLTLCIFIYVFFRPSDVLMHIVAAEILGQSRLQELQDALPFILPSWMIYSLPGGLWLFSALISLSKAIPTIPLQWKYPLIFGVVIIPIGMEVLQYFHLTDGTFDPLDIIFILIGAAASGLTYILLDKTSEQKTLRESWDWKWVCSFFVLILFFGDRFSI